MKSTIGKSSARRELTARVLLLSLILSLFPGELLRGEEVGPRSLFRPMAIKLLRPEKPAVQPLVHRDGEVEIKVERAVPLKPARPAAEVNTGTEQNNVLVDESLADAAATEPEKPAAYAITPVNEAVEIGPEDAAIEAMPFNEPQKIDTPPAQVVEYARNFWDEANEQIDKHKISISGTKTFEMKKSEVSGDVGHFSTENYDSMPGFHLDQSLHLEIDGNITENSTVHAILDDKDDEDRRFTVNIDGPVWKFVMGDFPLALEGTEFTLFRKEVRGIMAQGSFHEKFKSIFLFSQSKGQARREQFRGAGQQQEFRMQGSPVVQNSERVSIDGRLLTRGVDYLVDYEDGLIKFQPHLLPIEVTSWIVIEYEVSDKSLAFSRNLFGTRHIYTRSEGREIALSWLREVDNSTPKSGDTASSTATPMQHDILGADINWKISPRYSVTGETAVSFLDPNKNSELAPTDKCLTGHASKLALKAGGEKYDGDLTFKRIDKDFKVVGREGGVMELGERGLVNDILSGRARLEYRVVQNFKVFADSEKSQTNLSDDPALQSVDYDNNSAGFVWTSDRAGRIEIRGGRQVDEEVGPTKVSDMTRNSAAAVWDKNFGKLKTQAKMQNTVYNDAINLASDSSVLEMGVTMGAEADRTFAWNVGASRIAINDELSPNDLRSETRNYNLDLNYEPNRVFNARGLFQWRREDDFYANSRMDTEIADSQFRYEPTRDLRTQLKYKVENTSKVLRDPSLDPQKYILPPSLPNSETNKEEIVSTFENPVQKTTANFLTDYRINRYLQAYFDWRRRELIDQKTDKRVATNDRKTYELRYTPLEKMLVTTEFEHG
ncbi:MAG: hypothetical protein ACOYXC_11190, partial [Candidatus Rifleibacteriota bacterium]